MYPYREMAMTKGAMGQVVMVAMLSMCLVPVSFLVNRIVPEVYMDEMFHIPQAQEYCKGDFHKWDPMITTFPGLYLLSLVYVGMVLPAAKFLHVTPSLLELCNPAVLRSVNLALLLLCSLLFFNIIRHLEPKRSERKALAKAFLLSLYPLHWFFAFLYYTDVGSTTAVMAMYLAGLKRAYWISSLLAAIAVMFRQTNVVWVIFVVCAGILDMLSSPMNSSTDVRKELTDIPSIDRTLRILATDLEDLKGVRRRRAAQNSSLSFISPDTEVKQKGPRKFESRGLVWEVHALVKLAWAERTMILQNFSPLIAVILAFFAFVLHNGGIVVGAKDAHKVSPHFAQICYFGLVTAAALAPVHFWPHRIYDAARQLHKRHVWVFALGGCTLAFLFVHYFSFAHPYLLADNRHYTFYLWKKVICAHWSAKYCLIPLYVYSWWSIYNCLQNYKSKLWILVLFVGIVGVLVPTPLIEFRYYTIPMYLIALHCRMEQDHEDLESLLVALIYTAVNVSTMYLFLYRPFQWAHEPGVQRFMW
ncbi:dol-P-Glc:Glc(2)Man(9)GlcNAc(2)-PP-Dol alpha-1,2-glucosyltransferase [Physcomitrium patens]|uniref:Dol-P-Glc:Glc(2)Man(9)GlcNAc(2)-PP-Dol alpha-1,2-glucosyltransferase n=1 Tax=Physcomitrium patens TaxID=3218 RepID=A0A2K1KN62_PHYPA|nr:dol-P-Glc:Glc(2)Man(9)GlcNAc(2)-PP-Dol alpha-1,2-glucosyltransferase-like isoform X2 [Physcomitrium patens]PNR55218.1 hypothetical protein PHYPA_006113 [Physcomitrium patens]|eukprot:XP_024372620.1 dol-P-Glc:Glc(2)Man(9)GlcNAc(2)-PP-Dol alpha-1,2-glucosyltransferase-like isoform X2 [Physcomitrella patens]